MRHRLLPTFAAAWLALVLGACGSDRAGADADASPDRAVAASAAGARAVVQPGASAGVMPRNHIELEIDGETFRADSASSRSQRFQGIPDDPRYDVTMASGWVGNNEMSIVKLSLLNVDGRSRIVLLDNSNSRAPALMLFEVPGRKSQRWRSTAGILHLQFDDGAFEQSGMAPISGHFQATLRQLDRHRDEFLDDGEEITVNGRFDFSRDSM